MCYLFFHLGFEAKLGFFFFFLFRFWQFKVEICVEEDCDDR